MKNATTILLLSALASAANAQSFSGSVDVLANVSGGSRTVRQYASLLSGKTSTRLRLDNIGSGVVGFCEAYAGPGLLWTSREVSSIGTPYGQSWGKATYRDAIRWTGTAPITVHVRARLVGALSLGGSRPLQTDASAYANLNFFGPTLVKQTMQRTKSVEGSDTTRSGVGDFVVTLQPGRWYTFESTLQVNGDASDSTREFTPTFSSGEYSLKIWFESTTLPLNGSLQSVSGHNYATEPVLPAVQ